LSTNCSDAGTPQAVDRLADLEEPVDVLVNNAGIAESAPLEATGLDVWERHLAVNATGPFLCTRALLPAMVERGWGRVITVASTTALAGNRCTSAYTASKHAAVGLMRAVAAEVATSGVTANAVCPSYIDTPLTTRAVENIVTAPAVHWRRPAER
jgi:NAD(P)-dependent dehydrogenase (short-subunit alcohol dehydrogenase family)